MNGRVWTMHDLDQIELLEQECFSVEPWNRRMLMESFLSQRFFGVLLEEDGVVTAYGGIQVLYEDAELLLLATAEMYRRCGRGQKLLDDLIAEAKRRGAKRMFLEVRVSNAPAQLMYLKNGFVGTYARPRYYPDGEDALVMKKELG